MRTRAEEALRAVAFSILVGHGSACFSTHGLGGGSSATAASTSTTGGSTSSGGTAEPTTSTTGTTSAASGDATHTGSTSGEPMTTGDASTTDVPDGECSDGVVDADEECDDGNRVDDDGCSNECILPRLIFVYVMADEPDEQSGVTGNLGGMEGAHQKCNEAAQSAGYRLPDAVTFKAWLSDGVIAPVAFMDTDFTGWYILPNKELVAKGWPGLASESHLHPINQTAEGWEVTLQYVWTNVLANGDVPDEGSACSGWKSGSLNGFPPPAGSVGLVHAENTEWTYSSSISCGFKAALYCIQDTI